MVSEWQQEYEELRRELERAAWDEATGRYPDSTAARAALDAHVARLVAEIERLRAALNDVASAIQPIAVAMSGDAVALGERATRARGAYQTARRALALHADPTRTA